MASQLVLYIEDDRASRMVVESVLRSVRGVDVTSAGTGAEGLEVAAARRPAIVLIDAHLPDMEAAAVVERLVAMGTRVLVVSADVTSAPVTSMLAAGAVDCVAKPFDLDELVTSVSRMVG